MCGPRRWAQGNPRVQVDQNGIAQLSISQLARCPLRTQRQCCCDHMKDEGPFSVGLPVLETWLVAATLVKAVGLDSLLPLLVVFLFTFFISLLLFTI